MTARAAPAAERPEPGKGRTLPLVPGWLAYAVSLAMPVLASDDLMPGMRGWQAFRASFEGPFLVLTGREEFTWHDADVLLYFIPNVVMLASPLLVVWPSLWERRGLILTACVAALLAACLPLRSVTGLRLGYWTWFASMVLLAGGALSKRARPRV